VPAPLTPHQVQAHAPALTPALARALLAILLAPLLRRLEARIEALLAALEAMMQQWRDGTLPPAESPRAPRTPAPRRAAMRTPEPIGEGWIENLFRIAASDEPRPARRRRATRQPQPAPSSAEPAPTPAPPRIRHPAPNLSWRPCLPFFAPLALNPSPIREKPESRPQQTSA
jgi:hypothetical protein